MDARFGTGPESKPSEVCVQSSALLTQHCGENADAEIGNSKVDKAVDGTAMYNVTTFLDDEFSSLDDIRRGYITTEKPSMKIAVLSSKGAEENFCICQPCGVDTISVGDRAGVCKGPGLTINDFFDGVF